MRAAIIFYVLLILACSPKKSVDSNFEGLPFYNSPDFTPQWINPDNPGYHEIHRIAPFSFLDQNGKEVNNKTFEGKIYVANYFFSICPGICPLMTENMIALQNHYSEVPDLLFLSHTVTPWIDTVEVLKAYAEENGAISDKYFLVTGDKKEIYDLARTSYFVEKEIGFKTDADQFLHSENFILIDRKGRIRGVYNGTISNDLDRLKQNISTLRQEKL